MHTVPGKTHSYGSCQAWLSTGFRRGRQCCANLKNQRCCKQTIQGTFNRGMGLQPAKKAYRFSEKHMAYLTDKFNIGQSTRRKVDASLVARDMRSAHSSNGERLFKSTEFLTSQQSIFIFLPPFCETTTPQQTHEVDLAAIEEEINFSTARDEVMATVTLQHPIMFDQYNICAMAEKDTLRG